MTADVVWEHAVGSVPFKVTVFEMATRKRVLYLRWRRAGNWKYESLAPAAGRAGFASATLYDERGRRLSGRQLREKQQWAIALAEAKFAQLRAGLPDEQPKAPLTLSQTWDVVSDPQTGKYPVDNPHRREVDREFKHAVRILGADRAWESLRTADLTSLWRTRIRELRAAGETGMRGAEVCVARALAIAQWLRDLELVPKDACVIASTWREDLRRDWRLLAGSDRDPEPARPRYTRDEMHAILKAAERVDPRFDLLLSLGAELRLGQVIRARRTDIRRDGDAWRLAVFGAGHKKGTVVHLTPGQTYVLEHALHPDTGYLRELEAARVKGELADYALFPTGKLREYASGHPYAPLERGQKPIGADRIDDWWLEAETIAGIPHLAGRGAYGVKRTAVDEAKKEGISREGLKAHGGWTDTQMPDRIYAEQEQEHAREEAMRVRAKIRGEQS